MIARLSDLLRASLAGDAADEVSLDEELALVDLYLDIEKVRFADRLEVHSDVDPEARRALVPQLILQPLVENAVRHGISRSSSAGRIDLVARRHGEALRLEVSDDGPGLGEAAAPREGIGLSNVRGRLSALYGEDGPLTLEDRAEGGCRARLEIPWRTPKA